jgi:hypothetical protein
MFPTSLLHIALDMGIDYRIQPRHEIPTRGYGCAISAEDMSIDTTIKGRCKNKQKRRQKQRISKTSRRKNRS